MSDLDETGGSDPIQNLIRRGSKWKALADGSILEVVRVDADGVIAKDENGNTHSLERKSLLTFYRPVR